MERGWLWGKIKKDTNGCMVKSKRECKICYGTFFTTKLCSNETFCEDCKQAFYEK